MRRTSLLIPLLAPLIAFASLGAHLQSPVAIHYNLQFESEDGRLNVGVLMDSPKETETFRIPSWSPGYYQIAKYQDQISRVRAVSSEGVSLKMTKGDERSWVVSDPGGKPFTFMYSVLGNDAGLGFFATAVHAEDGFVNGASAMVYVEGRKEEPVGLRIKVPADWDLVLPLDKDDFGEYIATNYDELIDSPIQAGKFTRKTFQVDEIPFEAIYVAPDGEPKADLDEEAKRLEKLVAPAIKKFGGAPFKHYTFIVHLAPGSFSGGLEHRASTVINILNTKPIGADDLFTHEYFHAWNIKNIRPISLGPFDYTKAVRTDNLWFAEGVTDYYAKLTAYESGLDNASWLMIDLSNQVAELDASKSKKTHTLAEASRAAWEGGSEGIGDLSYYTKGLLVGLIFDADIRTASNGSRSLDDVMRKLYARHKLPLPGYQEDEILKTINEVAGTDMTALYKQMVYSTKELPYDDVRAIGLRIRLPNKPYIDPGFQVDARNHVYRETSEVKAKGLLVHDHVTLEKQDESSATFTVQRGDQIFHITLPIKKVISPSPEVEADPMADAYAEKQLAQWLIK